MTIKEIREKANLEKMDKKMDMLVDASFHQQNVRYCIANFLKTGEREFIYVALRSAIIAVSKLDLKTTVVNNVIKGALLDVKALKHNLVDHTDNKYLIERVVELGGDPDKSLVYLVLATCNLINDKRKKAPKR